MLNQSVIVGRVVRDPELNQTENGNKVTNLTLAVPRSYKNINGEYDTDFISCVLWKGVAENTQYHIKETYKLKEYFDILLGYNLYDLFPEIKDNL